MFLGVKQGCMMDIIIRDMIEHSGSRDADQCMMASRLGLSLSIAIR